MAEAPVVELGRVASAVRSGLGLAFALVFVFAGVYVADQRDVKWDFSYARTAKPGDSTRKIVRGLTDPVQAYLFFPPANDVESGVAEYFDDLKRESPQLQVEHLDRDVDPAKARELGVSSNGVVVIARANRREQLYLGVKMESARSQLSTLDQEVQKRLLMVTKSKRTVYFSAGHGEKGEERGPMDQRATVSALKELLRSQNYEAKPLSAADGLASEVPADAAAVLVIGPSAPLLPEELNALSRYAAKGGRLLLALEPDSKADLNPLLATLGLKVGKGTLANDRVFVRRSFQVSDRANLATAAYSSHPAVTTLAQLGGAPIFFLGAVALEALPKRPAEVTVDFPVRSQPTTWNDLNGDFEFNAPQEVRKSWELVAAVTRRKAADSGGAAKDGASKESKESKDDESGRALVVGDADLYTDLVLRNAGNGYFALDGVRWLMGDDAIVGQVNSEVDRPIEHTRKQDVAWFYGSIILAPLLVLAIGFFATRRRKRKAAGRGRVLGQSGQKVNA
jgi:hypothetical protein